MALRPVDLQLSILQASQTAPIAQKETEGPVAAQAATQQQFASKVQERQESVGTVDESEFSRVRADERDGGEQTGHEGSSGRRRRRQSPPDGPAFVDDDHFIDYSA